MTFREHYVNSLDNFIKGWYIDETVCDRLIDIFESNLDISGKGKSVNFEVDTSYKDSIDVAAEHLFNKGISLDFYNTILQQCFNLYNQSYPYSGSLQYSMKESYNIQKYEVGGGFKAWHTERAAAHPLVYRHLVFMTYLNDVTDEGETEFYHQKLKIKPEKGLTLIWPTDWTFVHRGVPSKTQVKYVATGWVSI